MSRLSVHVGTRDVTNDVDSLSFSNVDPGGYEICQLALTDAQGIRPGEGITVREGTETCWDGRVNEPGDGGKGDRQAGTVAAVGHGSALKDNPYREIYVEQDLGRWREPSQTRLIALQSLGGIVYNTRGTKSVTPDPVTGAPALMMEFNRLDTSVAASRRDLTEAWYDAQGIDIAAVYYDQQQFNIAVADWQLFALLSSDDNATTSDATVDLSGTNSAAYLTATGTPRRYAVLQFLHAGTFTGDSLWRTHWRKLAVYGRHGLPRRGTDPGGFYPSDIALDALKRSEAGIARGVVQESSGLIVPHCVYLDPTPAEKVIDDMAKLMGWHWGVWDSPGLFSEQPVLHFHPTPARATCVVSRAELTDLDPPKIRLDALYDRARVGWKDPAGTSGYAEVEIPNPILNEAGESRTLELDLGVGSEGAAEAFGRFALLLSQHNARGGGSCTVPQTVRLPGGQTKPATLLKAGRDRIRITDLPDAGMITETDTRRLDTFRVRRVETTVDDTGVPRTRVEFDGGADLLEVLQARLAIASTLAGA